MSIVDIIEMAAVAVALLFSIASFSPRLYQLIVENRRADAEVEKTVTEIDQVGASARNLNAGTYSTLVHTVAELSDEIKESVLAMSAMREEVRAERVARQALEREFDAERQETAARIGQLEQENSTMKVRLLAVEQENGLLKARLLAVEEENAVLVQENRTLAQALAAYQDSLDEGACNGKV